MVIMRRVFGTWCPEALWDGSGKNEKDELCECTGKRRVCGGNRRLVVRGGSWYSRPKLSTASFRRAYRPYAPVYDVGFRVVVEP